jgi:alpha-beta hydrolase superfamily lysophospholipase
MYPTSADGPQGPLVLVLQGALVGAAVGLFLHALARHSLERAAGLREWLGSLRLPPSWAGPVPPAAAGAALGGLFAAFLFAFAASQGRSFEALPGLTEVLLAATIGALVGLGRWIRQGDGDPSDALLGWAVGGAGGWLWLTGALAYAPEVATLMTATALGALAAATAWPRLHLLGRVWPWWGLAYVRSRRMLSLAAGTGAGLAAGLGALAADMPRAPAWVAPIAASATHIVLWLSAAKPPLQPVTEQRIQAGELVALTVHGMGPGYLLAHGFRSSGESWRPVLEEFRQRGLRAAAVDLPAWRGDAAELAEAEAIPQLARVIGTACSELECGILVAHSLAGVAGFTHLVSGATGRVEGIVAVSPPLELAAWTRVLKRRPGQRATVSGVTHLPWVVRWLVRAWGGREAAEAMKTVLRELDTRQARAQAAGEAVALFRALGGQVLDLLKVRLQRRPLVILGGQDRLVRGSTVAALASAAGFDVKQLPGAHSPHLVDAAGFAEVVLHSEAGRPYPLIRAPRPRGRHRGAGGAGRQPEPAIRRRRARGQRPGRSQVGAVRRSKGG